MKKQIAGHVERFKEFASPPVVDVEVHDVFDDWDDGDPLWEVDATISFEDGTKERIYFDWVRSSLLKALRNPTSERNRIEVWEKINDEW